MDKEEQSATETQKLVSEEKKETRNDHDPKKIFPQHAHPPSRIFQFMPLLSIGLYYLSYIMDIILLYDFAMNKHWKFFAYILTCVIFPTVVNHLLSYKMYLFNHDGQATLKVKLFHIFMSGPAYRQWTCFGYGRDLRQQFSVIKESGCNYERFQNYKETAEKYLTAVKNTDLLSFYYVFLKGGPQVTLQLYILLSYQLSQHKGLITLTHAKLMANIVKDVIMIGKSMACFKQSLRKSLGRKLNWYQFIIQFIYRVMFIASRVLTIVLFATIFHGIAFGVLAFHALLMYFWLRGYNTQLFVKEEGTYNEDTTTKGRYDYHFEMLAKVAFAIIFTFCYITTAHGDTLILQSTYYLFMFVENVSLMGIWMFTNGRSLDTYEIVATSLVFSTFLVGAVLLVIFYGFFHPTTNPEVQWFLGFFKSCRNSKKNNSEKEEENTVANA